MTLNNFLKLHQGGCACVSVHQLPYDYSKCQYNETYFNEFEQEDILQSDTYKNLENREVDHFTIIGGGMYAVELCVYLKED